MKTLLLFIFTCIAINLHSQNKIESSLEESYSNNTWQNSAGTNYQYDANNNLTSETRYNWNAGVWIPSYKSQYTYNANNKVLIQTEQNWNTSTNQFNDAYRTTYTYDSSAKLITMIFQDWIAGAWVNTDKSDIAYNGNLITTVAQPKWINSQWVNDFRNTSTYTGVYLSQWLTEKWVNSQWENTNRSFLTYNVNNKITNNREDKWSGTAWTEEYSSNYVLAVNGNRTGKINSYLGSIVDKEDHNYDSAAQMSSFVHPFKDKTGLDYTFEDFPYVNKILNSLSYNYDIATAAYALAYRTTYNYQSPIVLNTKSFESKTIKLYPNPTSSILNIDTDSSIIDVRIIDISGRTTTIKNAKNKAIDVSGLAKGIYFVEVKTNEGLHREKFIKN